MFGNTSSHYIIFHTFCEDIQFKLHPAAPSALEKFVMLKGLSTTAIQAKLLLFIVVISVLASWTASAQYKRAVNVETSIAKSEVLARQIVIEGRVRSGPPYEISAPLTAVTKIEELRTGDFVQRGQKLAKQNTADLQIQQRRTKLDLEETQQNKQQAQTDLKFRQQLTEVAKSRLRLLRQKADRAKNLVSKGTLSVEAFETVQTNLLSAEEQLLVRQQAISELQAQDSALSIQIKKLHLDLDELDRDIKSAELLAPISGQLVDLIEGNNRFMRKGERIARIRNQANFEIEAQIPADFIPFVEQAGQVKAERHNVRSLRNAGNNRLQLIFRATLPEENTRTGTRTVRFKVAVNLPADLQADNTPVNVFIPTSPPVPVVTVPQDSLIPVSGGHVVFVVVDETVSRRRVSLGGTDGDKVIITDGLAAGDVIVVKGNEGLSDGSKVQIPDSQSKNKNGSPKKPGQAKKWSKSE
tara:strand:+ start:1802 stop:3208 length:1407 start_codon:yes stop_codon:yes gene_type:complete